MKMNYLFGKLFPYPIPLLAVVMLITLSCGSIHDAASCGDRAKIKALLKNDPELVSSRDNGGRTPLHHAASWGYKDVAELLLTNKADINAKNNFGQTPLHEAASFGHRDVVEFLLDKKADVNAKNNYGHTPLYEADVESYNDVAIILRQHGGHK
jgi:26S proteasome non-ATPase regulatory subunit 10